MKQILIIISLFLVLFSFQNNVNAGPSIIFKTDDLRHSTDPNLLPEGWVRFVELIQQNEIKATIGIIGRYLVSGTDLFHDTLKAIYKEGSIDFWNHGYTHGSHIVDGESYSEFVNSPFWQQKLNLELKLNLA